jgi:hypothetical protein
MSMDTGVPGGLSDSDLEAAVIDLARGERASTASLVAHLAELYGRRLHERAGFSSLFTYCLEVLRLSEHEAYDRMKAAKVARRYPKVIDWLVRGEVNLTTVRLLAPHLTPANHEELFGAARGKRKRQVQELLASRFPQADVAASIRQLPARPAASAPGGLALPVRESVVPSGADVLSTPEVTVCPAAPAPAPARIALPAPPPPLVRPLAPERYQVTFTASTRTREMLELAQDLLRHAIPSGDPAQVFARALEVLVEDLLKKKFAVARRARTAPATSGDSRHVPAAAKRAVYLRDRGRCVFVGAGGRVCGERAFVEFDHHPVPYAAGGRSTVDNLQLRCRAHNQFLADAFFGVVANGRARSGTTARGRGTARGASHGEATMA